MPPKPLQAPSLYRRLAALLYESIVLFGVAWLAALLYGLAVGQRSGVMDRHGLQAVVFLTLAIYFIGFWLGPGQTVAMRAWRLRVVDANGRPLRLGRAGLRFVLGWLWVLPALALAWLTGLDHVAGLGMLFGWMALWALASYLRADRQFWHDAWAGTRLIDIPR
ncbi:Membrane protein (fragment) [Thiomonas sp. X19]|uniref:RDD family protein n=1 Tax=Thiomonas sp. X19 TaxID=1050370 RepID=UPI000B66E45A